MRIKGEEVDQDYADQLEQAMDNAKYEANIDGWGDEGAGYNFEKMVEVFLNHPDVIDFLIYTYA